MIGSWRLRCGLVGKVDVEQGELLFGFIFISVQNMESWVPSYWNKNGNSVCHDFDLITKIAGPEYFSERSV